MINKYDWLSLKIQYLKSDYISVTDFIKIEMKAKRNGAVNKAVSGWAEEKLQMKMEVEKEAKEDIKRGLKKNYKLTEEELSRMYEGCMNIFKAKLYSNNQKIKKMPDGTIIIPPDVNINENKIIWEVLKTEKGEPIRKTDRDDLIPLGDEDDEDDVTFYLPDNGREGQKLLES